MISRLEKDALLILRRLQKAQPRQHYPVKLTWGQFSHCAEISFDGEEKCFVITLSRKRLRTRLEIEDALLHEYAHTFNSEHWTRSPHGPEWGVAYARLYRAFHRTR